MSDIGNIVHEAWNDFKTGVYHAAQDFYNGFLPPGMTPAFVGGPGFVQPGYNNTVQYFSSQAHDRHFFTYTRDNDLLREELNSPDKLVSERAALALIIWYVESMGQDRDLPHVDQVGRALQMFHMRFEQYKRSIIPFVKGGEAYDLIWDRHQKIQAQEKQAANADTEAKPEKDDEFPF